MPFPPRNALRCVSICIPHRPTSSVTIFICHAVRLSFDARSTLARFVRFHLLHNARTSLGRAVSLSPSFPHCPSPSSRYELSISRPNAHSSASTSTRSAVAHFKPRWPRYDLIVRCSIYDAITSFAVPPHSDCEPAARPGALVSPAARRC